MTEDLSMHRKRHALMLDSKLDAHAYRALIIINAVLLLGILVHDGDHIRQAVTWGYTIPVSLLAINLSVYVPSAVSIFLTRLKRPSACIVTGCSGILVALAFAKVHLFGASNGLWGIWNDSYFLLNVDTLSWAMLWQIVLIGIITGCASFYQYGRLRALVLEG